MAVPGHIFDVVFESLFLFFSFFFLVSSFGHLGVQKGRRLSGVALRSNKIPDTFLQDRSKMAFRGRHRRALLTLGVGRQGF